jgi:hypothetical protein
MLLNRPAGQTPATQLNGYEIAVARLEDVPAVQAVAGETWRTAYRDIFAPEFIERFLARAYGAEHLERAFQDARTRFVVARVAGEVVGFGQVGPPSHPEDAPPDCGELYRLYILPTWQRRGIGRGLLGLTEIWLADQGYVRYGCYVHARNAAARAFYWQVGFNRVPSRDLDDEWYLVKNLNHQLFPLP